MGEPHYLKPFLLGYRYTRYRGCGQNLGPGPWASLWATLWASIPERNEIIFQPLTTNQSIDQFSINTARSALSSILVLEDGVKFGELPLVARCLNGIFELKPAYPNIQKFETLILC